MHHKKHFLMLFVVLVAGSQFLSAQVKTDTVQLFSFPEHGFAAAFPRKPVKTKPKYTYDSTSFNTIYTLVDSKEGIYYQCLVQDMARSFFLSADSAVFDSYKNNLLTDESTVVISERRALFQHYPAMWLDLTMKKDEEETYTRVLSVHRGNRIYFLFTILPGNSPNEELMDRFFNSFILIPQKESAWKRQESSDKSLPVWSPMPMTMDSSYNTDQSVYILDEFYKSYDSAAPGTLYIEKLKYSPYYWAASDTALLRSEANSAIDPYTDSLLDYRVFQDGTYSIADVKAGLKDNHNLKQIRFVLHGDILYKMFVVLPHETLKTANYQKFFNSFKPVENNPGSNLYVSKAKKLLDALQIPDSVQFEKAKTMLEKVRFTREDIPYLHEALLLNRKHDTTSYYTATHIIGNIITDLNDDRTAQFVEESYTNLPDGSINQGYELLSILARRKTTESYALISELLKSRLPKGDNIYRLSSYLYDSLALSFALLPHLKPLLKDTLAASQVLELAETLIDSGFVKKDFLSTCKTDMYALADDALVKLGKNSESEELYKHHVLIRLLAKLSSAEALSYVNRFAAEKNIHLKYTAVTSLIDAGKIPNARNLQQLAATNEYRTNLYEHLRKAKKLLQFPKEYFNQKALAESDVYNYIIEAEEYDLKSLQFVSEQVVYYRGRKKKFYLFKADMSYEEEKNIRLAVAGPYNTTAGTVLVTNPPGLGIYWEDDFNPKKINSMLQLYLKQLEEQNETVVEPGLQ